MTITPDQAEALSGYLQWIGFTGMILDPNDHDESVHHIATFLPPEPYIRVYSFKPASHPHVLNGGHLSTYGVATDSMDAIITSEEEWSTSAVAAGVRALKPGGLFFLCVMCGEVLTRHRALLTKMGITYAHVLKDSEDHILIGRKPGGA